MELEFLAALVMVFGVSALSIFLLHSIRIPAIVGFILAGVLIGPHGIGTIKSVHEIEMLADIGIILLLFTVGIEFSLTKLIRMKNIVICGGGGQVALTILVSAAVTYPFVGNLNSAVFLGFLTALSSTAIVLKMLLERGEMDSPQGRTMTGILIFQDLCVVPLMLLIPALSGDSLNITAIAATMLKATGIVGVVLLSARWIVPGPLHQIALTRSRELFLLTVILLCLSVALLTSKFGLSLALGAFLAGMIISDSEYAYEAAAEILPFKDSFMGLFFVSIGMMINTDYLSLNWPGVLLVVLTIFSIKVFTATVSLLSISTPVRTALQSGLGLAHIGEFSFVLAAAGKTSGLISENFFQMFLPASVITMALTPVILGVSPAISTWLASREPLKRLNRIKKEEGSPSKLSGHVIIVGFGMNGRNLARTLRETGIPYVVLELNSTTVGKEKKKGQPIYFGDATNREILHKFGIERAKLLVGAISDPASTRKIVVISRRENPAIHIIARTRYLSEVEDLKRLGADEVIPEEFETSIEIFSRVLHHYSIPKNVITDHMHVIRKDNYKVLRNHDLPEKPVKENALLSEIPRQHSSPQVVEQQPPDS